MTEHLYTSSSGSASFQGRLYQVLPFALDVVWNDARKLLITALDYADGKYCLPDIWNDIKRGDCQMWVSFGENLEAVCVTSLVNYPRSTRLLVKFAAGRLEYMLPHFQSIISWAKSVNTSKYPVKVEVWGRKGWERVLKPMGFEPIHNVMRMR